LDSDILHIEEYYTISDDGCLWVAESIDDCDNNKQQTTTNSGYDSSKKIETV
jgi:hypothetical protein